MKQNLADDLCLGNGGDEPQAALLTPRTGCHIDAKDALKQFAPAPARHAASGLGLAYAPLTWSERDGASQFTVRRQAAAIAHLVHTRRWNQRRQLLRSSNGDSLMPIVPSDHRRVKR